MSSNNPRIILHVDMDYFFAQCEEKMHPELKGKPAVICVYSGSFNGCKNSKIIR